MPRAETKARIEERKKEILARNESIHSAMTKKDDREGKCTAMTTGIHGPKRPCTRWAIKGGTVCPKHGGSAPQVKRAAKERLLAAVDPTLSRLMELRDQDEHLPTALGAATHILSRALGVAGKESSADKASMQPTINIGIALGGLPERIIQVQASLPEGDSDDDDDVIEAEVDE